MKASDLDRKKVFSADGRALGRVHELHIENGKVTFFLCGTRAFFQRLFRTHSGRRIPWKSVARVMKDRIVLKL